MTWSYFVRSPHRIRVPEFDTSLARSNISRLYKAKGEEARELDYDYLKSLYLTVQKNFSDNVLVPQIKKLGEDAAKEAAKVPNGILAKTYNKIIEGVIRNKWIPETISIEVPQRPKLRQIVNKLAEVKNKVNWLSASPVIYSNGLEFTGAGALRKSDSIVAAGLGSMEIPIYCTWEEKVIFISVPVGATLFTLKERIRQRFPNLNRKSLSLEVKELDLQLKGDYINTDKWNVHPLLYLGITSRVFEGEGVEDDCQILLHKVPVGSVEGQSSSGPDLDPSGGPDLDPSGQGKDSIHPGQGPSRGGQSGRSSHASSSRNITAKGKGKGGGANDCKEEGFSLFGGVSDHSLNPLKRCNQSEIPKLKRTGGYTKRLRSSSSNDDAQHL